MAWGIPAVVGPLNEWLDHVPVEGCWPGAQVVVRTDDAAAIVVAKGISKGGIDHVPLVAGPLKAGRRLVAQQSVSGDDSDWTPSDGAVVTGAAPKSHAQLPQLAFESTLYHCGTALWLSGTAPGAQVKVSEGPTELGTSLAGNSGSAVVGVAPFMPSAGTKIRAVQSAPAGFLPLAGSPVGASASTVAIPLGPLRPPSIKPPYAMGCESTVVIGDVFDGAKVTVERQSDNQTWTATFHASELPFALPKPFPAVGDRIAVTQAVQCHRQPSGPAFADIQAAHEPDTVVVDPPCAGATSVHVANLRPGATLAISVQGQSDLKYIVPPERTTWDVPVPALPAKMQVTATLTVCGFSTSTTVAIVDEAPAPHPQVLGDLFHCGRAVAVSTRIGAFLEIWGDSGSGPAQISLRVRADRPVATVDVFPHLATDQKVWARQLACGGGWQDSDQVAVQPTPQLEPVELRDPVEFESAVLPLNFVSGACLTVWAEPRNGAMADERIGKRNTTRSSPVIGLTRRLREDDTIWVEQEICSERSWRNPRYNVIPGVKRFAMPGPKKQPSGRSSDGKVIVHSAELICRFADGSWVLVADAESTERGYDCSLHFGVTLRLTAPMSFGETLDIDLAAAGGGLPSGLHFKGYPSRWRTYKEDHYPQLQSLPFWLEVLGTTADWKLQPAWSNHLPEPDPPQWVEGNRAPADPMQLLPKLPTDG